MTERQACERIVQDGDCVGVLCGNCPLFEGDWDCTDMDEVTLAEMWLRLHPTEKKLVFSAEKFYADDDLPLETRDGALSNGWPERCEGKTKEECNLLGFGVHADWMEER